MAETTQIKIEAANGGVITLLTGKALEQKHPEKIKLSGNIDSVKNFLEKRYGSSIGKGLQEVDKQKACVIVDETAMSLQLLLDPENFFGLEVMGKLELHGDLKPFFINENKEFTREELVNLLKFSKRFFDDPLKHEELLKSYQKLNLSGTTRVKAESDDRGNRDMEFKKTIDSQNIPLGFMLKMPIFKGQPAEMFRVEICLNVSDLSVRFWFISVELVELIEKRKQEIFAAQLQSCTDFVIITK